ncbi:cell division control protein 6 [Dioscorea alata]|uniref:Cell division control protein 6 n=1 Tax=Dioscorea alata TaxID=55571 RepID=A0ACB7VGU6_DIOAL|nr:cell division control protein 6 [Dioscorea alata]
MPGSKIPSFSSASELGSAVVVDLEIAGRCQGSSTSRKRSRSQSALKSSIKNVPSPAKRIPPRRCSNAIVDSKGEIKLDLQQCCDDSNGEPLVVSSPKILREERSSDPCFQTSTWNPRDPAQIQAVKEALHVASAPYNIVCREDEQKSILDFCKVCIEQDKSGSLYVCGCPGTGKSLSVKKVKELLVLWAKEAGFQTPEVLSINCTLLTKASEIFSKVIEKFHPHLKNNSCSPLQDLQKLYSQKRQLSSGKMMMIIVDEMDYLRTKDHQVLHDLFMLSTLPYSQCILIGIANAIDLADRFLPRLESLNCKPNVVTYCAYSKDQILKIIQQRLIVLGYDIFEPIALEFCARKVAAASGDMRKALDVCRSAIEVFEAELRLATNKEELKIVRFDHMDIALSRAFKPLIVDTIQSLPQHQQIILCSVVKFFWQCKKNATTLGELNRSYSEICKDNHIPPVGMLEFTNMCRALSDQGLLNVGQSKEIKQKRVTLQIDGSDVRFALKEIRFFNNCLESFNK